MTSKLYLESISYDQDENKLKQLKYTKPHRKTTTAVLLRNAEATLNDITNSDNHNHTSSKESCNNISSSSTTIQLNKSTPVKSTNSNNPQQINILDNTSLSPKSSRYTIGSTPTKLPSNTTHNPNMMTLTQSQPTPSPVISVAKSLFTPTKNMKSKKKVMEKEIEMLKEKISIMERIGTDRDSDSAKLKMTLIETMTENDVLQKKVSDLEETIKCLKKELDKGSYESWKGYCSLQDSPPGVSTRYTKKRALGSNVSSSFSNY
ncbi:hypothetical protein DLAC_06510 [Tieghemostelium lacteum]|uniref:Uncharacterized protein n=1 Tax=Tieghemostelium lacteum TaxID=361077 RepID=A0A151ZEY3_TIELA|nr:hypothetical protein DLAC_06510 [Tieghemostelium lacteum]|eukprot:KYQ92521.1 hypothetical protein DLAC_06510 [Tieghemostelium lacteum]